MRGSRQTKKTDKTIITVPGLFTATDKKRHARLVGAVILIVVVVVSHYYTVVVFLLLLLFWKTSAHIFKHRVHFVGNRRRRCCRRRRRVVVVVIVFTRFRALEPLPSPRSVFALLGKAE